MAARNWIGTRQCDAGFDGANWLAGLVERGAVAYAAGQLEQGEETHHYHIQFVIQNGKTQRLSYMKKVCGQTHWEPIRGTFLQAKAYCTKEETRVAGPWEAGLMAVQGQRRGLDEAVAMIKNGAQLHEVAEEYSVLWVHHHKGLIDLRRQLNLEADRRTFGPEGPEVWVLYGPSGTGKSRFVKETWPDAFWKIPGEKWWDGYRGHETVVLDDFKDCDMRLTDLQRLLDWYPLWVEVKGGAIPMLAKRYVITSNQDPGYWYLKSDGHRTIMRRIRDFAEQHGRLIYCHEGWVPPCIDAVSRIEVLGNTIAKTSSQKTDDL